MNFPHNADCELRVRRNGWLFAPAYAQYDVLRIERGYQWVKPVDALDWHADDQVATGELGALDRADRRKGVRANNELMRLRLPPV